ncbi:Gfo/Idh/MocA family oxidoreductase [Paenibacillus hemerocallicola]|uniref:Gfo/Idh/MocA family oxidoreductase n=1 Tax=Paenibacillus hemerocallicola TaxID=1172614 RepID=A0A5C4T955_9BACL|nr:Gfo/Idh/MocA family oxidoreductase [Paenibacillus hemerocallicola]TNJ65608.1 Gfo/Idh/MocA family oxidoreductase [Paenibacillus hemerocallicola]
MAALRVGAVGTGGMFRGAHLPAWLANPDTEVVALCDANEEAAQKIADEHGIPAVYTDYNEMLARENLDIVNVCTPNLFHSEVAVAALKAGKHVFCEKPDAVSPEEAAKMAAAAEESGKVLMVMRNNRFRTVAQFLKAYVQNGHMGEIYTGRCGWIRRRGIPGKGGWFTTKELSGGGPLIDLGVHMIDLALWFMGNPKPVAVSGSTYTKFAETELADSEHSAFGSKQAGGVFDVEDLATGFIRFANGATLALEFSWASNIEQETRFVELRGTKSGFSLNNEDLKLFTEIEGTLCNVQPQIAKKGNGHGDNIHHFVDVVLGRAEPVFKPEQGVDMINILSAIYESAKLGREVRLD